MRLEYCDLKVRGDDMIVAGRGAINTKEVAMVMVVQAVVRMTEVAKLAVLLDDSTPNGGGFYFYHGGINKHRHEISTIANNCFRITVASCCRIDAGK